MYAATGGKWVAWAMVAIVAAFAVGAGALTLAAKLDDPIVRVRQVPAPLLTSSSTVADVASRFEGQPAQSIPGEQLGFQSGVTCDLRYVSDGGVFVCHG